MHSTGSLLLTCLERLRIHLDEASLDPKFTDNDILSHFIGPAYADVWSRINLNNEQPLVIRASLPVVAGTQYYMLPWGISEIWRVCAVDENNRIVWDARPRGKQHPAGPLWQIEGNMLSLVPSPQADNADVQIWYIPNGEFQMHYAATGGVYNTSTKVFTLSTAPTFGTFDRRPAAYLGQCFRSLPPAGIWQERYIKEYKDQTTTNQNVKFYLDPTPTFANTPTETPYEISAPGFESLMEAITLAAARKMGTSRKISQAHREAIIQEYKSAIKTVLDGFANIQTRTGKSFERMTSDRLTNAITRLE